MKLSPVENKNLERKERRVGETVTETERHDGSQTAGRSIQQTAVIYLSSILPPNSHSIYTIVRLKFFLIFTQGRYNVKNV